jgi:hypothetical protein
MKLSLRIIGLTLSLGAGLIMFAPHVQAAPATFTVTNTNDSGAGSLRQAIEDANGNGNPLDVDQINFNIAGAGVHTIAPNSMFQPLTEPATIDGFSQTGSQANTAAMPNPLNGTILIEIDGTNVGNQSQQAAFALFADNSTIQGLAMFGFAPDSILQSQANIAIVGDNAKVQGCYIGVRADGTTLGSVDREATGIISNGVGVLIGGENPAERNVIASFAPVPQSGGVIVNAGSATIYGNYIGLAMDGVTDFSPETSDPLQLAAPYNIGVNSLNDAFMQLGGTTTARQNVISGNQLNVALSSDANDDKVQGNKIGTNYAGQVMSTITNGYGVASTINDANLVGGTNPGEGNLIAGNLGAGVSIFGAVADADGSFIAATNRLAVIGNSIYGNETFDFQGFGASNLGIDIYRARITLGGPTGFTFNSYEFRGPTPNDLNDVDTGSNNYMNYPVLRTAQQVGNQLTITYDLDAADSPSDLYRVEFYANDESTIFGHGPGQTLLGAATSVAPGTNKTITLTVNGDVYKKSLSATTTALDNTTDTGFGATSEFSQNISIGNSTDFDADGVTDVVEDAAPNSGDGNYDGTLDRLQPTVSSYEIDSTGIYETFVTTGCSENGTVSSIEAATLSKQDSGKSYPYGLTDFSLNCSRGDTVNVTKYVFVDDQPSEYVLRKFNDFTDAYRDVPGSAISSQVIGGTRALVSSYSITDGGDLDDDGKANGIIVDPVGLATTASLADTGVGVWQYILGIAGLLGLGAYIARYTLRLHAYRS